MPLPPPASPNHIPCKCCSGEAALFGLVDFHKNCERSRNLNLGLSGIPIYYHRCTSCGFIFTIAFDHFTDQDFLDGIYNADYALVDPDYAETRPRNNAHFLAHLLSASKGTRILDYGGGNGKLAALLRSAGFTAVETYDPFVSEFAVKPTDRYECIVCFETIEHSTRPRQTFEEINSLLRDDGVLLFSTLFQPPNIGEIGVSWWYLAPRNGHVSLFNPAALRAILTPMGMKLGSFNDVLHVACRNVPPFARHFLGIRGMGVPPM
jgi:Methyltransferase domain